jgi:hypothetical protein
MTLQDALSYANTIKTTRMLSDEVIVALAQECARIARMNCYSCRLHTVCPTERSFTTGQVHMCGAWEQK